ncbi:MAG: DoxX family protein [Rhizobium sp.]|jgi:putative oxidoreductase|nr:DoxX family protein [Rhizobium sp.]MCZ8352045.1 DoxX family protein [Rhizobium sp.]
MSTQPDRLILPALAPLYRSGHDLVETLLRVVAGVFFMIHGVPKIIDPFGSAGMVEMLGFYPGAFWSLMLAITEFFGGILLAIGLFTRPAALAATFVLLVTVYFHWVTIGEGYAGAEKSLLWAAMTLFFVFRGGNVHSVDARLKKTF